MEGLENGRYVVAASSTCQKARGAVLNALKTLNLAAGGSEVEGVTVVQPAGHKRMD